MKNEHYGFFTSEQNHMEKSLNGVYLTSSSSSATKKDIKGFGTYMYSDNFRKVISLFNTRSLVKTSWIRGSNVYLSPTKDNN